ncbi:MAG: hypothetical protein FJ308_16985 [Planctomycetes bacterium]|nr:hypothetical protein [Planctomycetota bacterium]
MTSAFGTKHLALLAIKVKTSQRIATSHAPFFGLHPPSHFAEGQMSNQQQSASCLPTDRAVFECHGSQPKGGVVLPCGREEGGRIASQKNQKPRQKLSRQSHQRGQKNVGASYESQW